MAKPIKELITEEIEKIIKERHGKALSQDIEKTLNIRFRDLLKGEGLERS